MLVSSNDLAFLNIVKDLSVTLGVKTEMVLQWYFLCLKTGYLSELMFSYHQTENTMNRLAILLIGLAIVGFASGNWRRKETFMEWLKRREPDRAFISNEGKT